MGKAAGFLEKASSMGSMIATIAMRSLRKIPYVRRRIEEKYEVLLQEIERSAKPYRGRFPSFAELPEKGIDRLKIIDEIEAINTHEESKWKEGYVSGAVYHGDRDHIDFLNRVYSLTSQSNPLHADLWPSANKYESEIVSMTGRMLSSTNVLPPDHVCGTVTSGGTESILLAMKTYRDWAREVRKVKKPEMIIPVTAHAAFDKAAQYFKIKVRRIPVDSHFRADVDAAHRAVNRNTIVMVGSAPSFPHGAIDPIRELSSIAYEHGIGFHTDACLGGFILPWVSDLGYDVPLFDFELPGVTSISCDTHKYGYAAKGTSVVLYRSEELLHYQYFTTTDWPGGLYFSPTFAGSRPGALSAACWAAMVSMGKDGYVDATKKILATADRIKEGIRRIPELSILGDPLWVIAFTSRKLNIFRVMDHMTKRGWSLNGLHRPSCVHLCVTLRHTAQGVAERFIEDLEASVASVKANPKEKGGMAPVYGMAATLPDRSMVGELLKRYIDVLYRV